MWSHRGAQAEDTWLAMAAAECTVTDVTFNCSAIDADGGLLAGVEKCPSVTSLSFGQCMFCFFLVLIIILIILYYN